MFKHYSSLLKGTDVPKVVLDFSNNLYNTQNKVFMPGYEYLALTGLNIKSMFLTITNNKGPTDEHKETRLALVASQIDRQALLNYIEDKEKLIEQRVKLSSPHKIVHALQ